MTVLQEILGTTLLIFCRIGAALLLLPGFASPRMPMIGRLILALAICFAVQPLLGRQIFGERVEIGPLLSASILISEIIKGLAFGFWCYCFAHVARFAGSAIASSAGFGGIPGQPLDEQDPSTTLSTLISLGATALMFASDLHLLSLQALIVSYTELPVGEAVEPDWMLQQTLHVVKTTSTLALQFASPILASTVVANIALGLCSKFTPQFQGYFASLGLTMLASLAFLAWISPGLFRILVESYAQWLGASLP